MAAQPAPKIWPMGHPLLSVLHGLNERGLLHNFNVHLSIYVYVRGQDVSYCEGDDIVDRLNAYGKMRGRLQ